MYSLLRRFQNNIDDILENFGHYYIYGIISMHVIYFSALFGIVTIGQSYLRLFNIVIQLFICVFLMFRFHPFRKHDLREYDSKIIFGSAAFLLVNLGSVEFLKSFATTIENHIKK